jgi:polyisoprenoid-binding protein YceI
MKKTILALSMLSASQAWAASETYTIDATHSFANFTIRHVVSKASGTFNDVTGVITLDPANLNTASVRAKINVSSVNTGFAKRDEHIKADKYLDVAKYTLIEFESTKIIATNQTQAVMQGKLTMHGVTKLVDIPVHVLGYGSDPWGGQRAGFEGHITLKASEYGFGWATGSNAPVGDDIDVTLLIEGVKAK